MEILAALDDIREEGELRNLPNAVALPVLYESVTSAGSAA